MTAYHRLLPVAITVCLLVQPSSADEPKKETSPAFKQYVGVYTRNKPTHQVILQQPKVKLLGERAFLVGTPVEYAANFVEEPKRRLTADKAVVRWIALAEILEMYEFDDINGYRYDRE